MSETRSLAGAGTFDVDGLGFVLVENPKYRLHTVDRETMKSMSSGFDGYKEAPGTPYIEAVLRDMPGMSVRDFQDMTDVTVTMRLNSGKVISGTGMCCMTAVEVESADAKFTVRFEGPEVRDDA